jgi:ribonuclease HII
MREDALPKQQDLRAFPEGGESPPAPSRRRAGRDAATTTTRARRPHRSGNLFELDGPLWAAGHLRVAGVDEAGRGPLAGPVVAAAVIFEPRIRLRGLDDSKKLDAEARDHLFDRIRERAVAIGVGLASAEEIDEINILRATHRAAGRALRQLDPAPDAVVADHLKLDVSVPLVTVPRADARSHAVAAASIIAKVTRDRIMARLDEEYPGYGLQRHKGYPTPEHYAALERMGPSSIHRRTFAGVDFFGREVRPSATFERLSCALAAAHDAIPAARTAIASALVAVGELLPAAEVAELRELLERWGEER